jgi:hypothetical protein
MEATTPVLEWLRGVDVTEIGGKFWASRDDDDSWNASLGYIKGGAIWTQTVSRPCGGLHNGS